MEGKDADHLPVSLDGSVDLGYLQSREQPFSARAKALRQNIHHAAAQFLTSKTLSDLIGWCCQQIVQTQKLANSAKAKDEKSANVCEGRMDCLRSIAKILDTAVQLGAVVSSTELHNVISTLESAVAANDTKALQLNSKIDVVGVCCKSVSSYGQDLLMPSPDLARKFTKSAFQAMCKSLKTESNAESRMYIVMLAHALFNAPGQSAIGNPRKLHSWFVTNVLENAYSLWTATGGSAQSPLPQSTDGRIKYYIEQILGITVFSVESCRNLAQFPKIVPLIVGKALYTKSPTADDEDQKLGSGFDTMHEDGEYVEEDDDKSHRTKRLKLESPDDPRDAIKHGLAQWKSDKASGPLFEVASGKYVTVQCTKADTLPRFFCTVYETCLKAQARTSTRSVPIDDGDVPTGEAEVQPNVSHEWQVFSMAIEFSFFITAEIVAPSDANKHKIAKESDKGADSMVIVGDLLSLIDTHRLYSEAQDRQYGRRMERCLTQLLENVILPQTKSPMAPEVYQCWNRLVAINCRLLEPFLGIFWAAVLEKEEQLSPLTVSVAESIFRTLLKRRQMNLLLEGILDALQHPSLDEIASLGADDKQDYFLVSASHCLMWKALAKACQTTPSTQILSALTRLSRVARDSLTHHRSLRRKHVVLLHIMKVLISVIPIGSESASDMIARIGGIVHEICKALKDISEVDNQVLILPVVVSLLTLVVMVDRSLSSTGSQVARINIDSGLSTQGNALHTLITDNDCLQTAGQRHQIMCGLASYVSPSAAHVMTLHPCFRIDVMEAIGELYRLLRSIPALRPQWDNIQREITLGKSDMEFSACLLYDPKWQHREREDNPLAIGAVAPTVILNAQMYAQEPQDVARILLRSVQPTNPASDQPKVGPDDAKEHKAGRHPGLRQGDWNFVSTTVAEIGKALMNHPLVQEDRNLLENLLKTMLINDELITPEKVRKGLENDGQMVATVLTSDHFDPTSEVLLSPCPCYFVGRIQARYLLSSSVIEATRGHKLNRALSTALNIYVKCVSEINLSSLLSETDIEGVQKDAFVQTLGKVQNHMLYLHRQTPNLSSWKRLWSYSLQIEHCAARAGTIENALLCLDHYQKVHEELARTFQNLGAWLRSVDDTKKALPGVPADRSSLWHVQDKGGDAGCIELLFHVTAVTAWLEPLRNIKTDETTIDLLADDAASDEEDRPEEEYDKPGNTADYDSSIQAVREAAERIAADLFGSKDSSWGKSLPSDDTTPMACVLHDKIGRFVLALEDARVDFDCESKQMQSCRKDWAIGYMDRMLKDQQPGGGNTFDSTRIEELEPVTRYLSRHTSAVVQNDTMAEALSIRWVLLLTSVGHAYASEPSIVRWKELRGALRASHKGLLLILLDVDRSSANFLLHNLSIPSLPSVPGGGLELNVGFVLFLLSLVENPQELQHQYRSWWEHSRNTQGKDPMSNSADIQSIARLVESRLNIALDSLAASLDTTLGAIDTSTGLSEPMADRLYRLRTALGVVCCVQRQNPYMLTSPLVRQLVAGSFRLPALSMLTEALAATLEKENDRTKARKMLLEVASILHSSFDLMYNLLRFRFSDDIAPLFHLFLLWHRSVLGGLRMLHRGALLLKDEDLAALLESSCEDYARCMEQVAEQDRYVVGYYGGHLLGDIILMLTSEVLPSPVARSLDLAAYHILGVTFRDGVARLSARLDYGSRRLLKRLNETYRKEHVYRGEMKA
eukprot:Clim_evm4s20 gene=Clim_evmTU4s20